MQHEYCRKCRETYILTGESKKNMCDNCRMFDLLLGFVNHPHAVRCPKCLRCWNVKHDLKQDSIPRDNGYPKLGLHPIHCPAASCWAEFEVEVEDVSEMLGTATPLIIYKSPGRGEESP